MSQQHFIYFIFCSPSIDISTPDTNWGETVTTCVRNKVWKLIQSHLTSHWSMSLYVFVCVCMTPFLFFKFLFLDLKTWPHPGNSYNYNLHNNKTKNKTKEKVDVCAIQYNVNRFKILVVTNLLMLLNLTMMMMMFCCNIERSLGNGLLSTLKTLTFKQYFSMLFWVQVCNQCSREMFTHKT